MKIIFIVDETLVMLPEWLDNILSLLEDDYKVVAITPTGKKPGHRTIFSYLYQKFYKIPSFQLIKLFIFMITMIIRKTLFDISLNQKPATIAQVAKKHKIRSIPTDNVNDKHYLSILKSLKPDLIISSGSQIFKADLLNLPTIACINRHSGLLPSYGGLFPIFRAMLNKEKVIGVTIHYMVPEIDKGKIIYQASHPLKKQDSLFDLYKESYKVSVNAILSALEIIKKGKRSIIVKSRKPSYYSFPEDKDWEKFFYKGYKFI